MKKAIWIVLLLSVTLTFSWMGEADPGPATPEAAQDTDLTTATEAIESDAALTPASSPPECPASWRNVSLQCRGDSSGLITGQYGGTDFFLACNGDKASTSICAGGNGYRYIMEGQIPGGIAVRCADSGASGQVNEFCGPLHMKIN